PAAGVCEKPGLTPRRYLAELRTEDASEYTVGQEVTAEIFASGQYVDVTGKSKGKGFAGVMKRHGFKGLSSSHGTQRKHRSPGSIGACATPGHVFKGVRMAGRSRGRPGRAPPPPRPAATSAAAARSRTGRRAPAGLARARCALRTMR